MALTAALIGCIGHEGAEPVAATEALTESAAVSEPEIAFEAAPATVEALPSPSIAADLEYAIAIDEDPELDARGRIIARNRLADDLTREHARDELIPAADTARIEDRYRAMRRALADETLSVADVAEVEADAARRGTVRAPGDDWADAEARRVAAAWGMTETGGVR